MLQEAVRCKVTGEFGREVRLKGDTISTNVKKQGTLINLSKEENKMQTKNLNLYVEINPLPSNSQEKQKKVFYAYAQLFQQKSDKMSREEKHHEI